MTSRLLTVRGLALRSPERTVLEDVSLHVDAGEVVGLVGPSGCGKSLLAAAIAGQLPPDVRWAGEIVRAGRVGWAMQDANDALDPLRRLRAELRVTLAARPRPAAPADHDAAGWGAAVGLTPAQVARRPAGLSGGQRQRGVLALALAASPALLLADEPTASLDPAGRALVGRRLRRLAAQPGRGVLLISHDATLLADCADRVVRLADPHPPSAPAPARTRTRATAGGVALRLRDVSFRIGATRILDRVSLEVASGHTLALVGPSGSGKTTIARLAAGLLAPGSGEVTRRGGVAMVFQDAYGSLDPFWTVGRSIAEPLPRDLPVAARRREVSALLAAVGLPDEAARARPARFSGGQRQRIAIARALAARPALLICDEPTSALDAGARAALLDVLRAAQDAHGFAMLLASHDVETVAALADAVREMRDGRLLPDIAVATGP